MEPKKAVHAMREVLVKKGREVLMPRIARAFERLARREIARTRTTLTVARESDVARALREVQDIIVRHGLSPDVHTVVDGTLIGGWRLEGADHLVDKSFKKNLLSIYTSATQD